MSRIIKFRVILQKEKTIREAYGVNFLTKKALVLIGGCEEWLPYKEIMQSIGLLDKNGAEIFEGDIVETNIGIYEVRFGLYNINGQNTMPSDDYGYYIYSISKKYDQITDCYALHSIDGVGAYYAKHVADNPDNAIRLFGLEVIGNIFENLELSK